MPWRVRGEVVGRSKSLGLAFKGHALPTCVSSLPSSFFLHTAMNEVTFFRHALLPPNTPQTMDRNLCGQEPEKPFLLQFVSGLSQGDNKSAWLHHSSPGFS